MKTYTFLNLSPTEFEDLSRDLLQKHLNLTFESFASGRDNGIDLRYAENRTDNIIVQCKRYSDFKSFFQTLKKEAKKVDLLRPKSYIITTSVSLTPSQKNEIIKLFNPYIQSTADILGNEDLNNLLGLYPTIEKQHFKLWLSSTEILERILHSKVYNQSVFEEDEINETIRTYVENDSYNESLRILDKNKFVIISGIPGIGKTTLARILVYHFLASGFEEFIYLSDTINEGYQTYKDGVKQIFLFDDFLGRNFLEQKLSNNEEQRIVRFMEKISRSDNKLLVLTTREYILTQARHKYDVFEKPILNISRCTIDLSQYTKIIRARILYNHLFFSNITRPYLEGILKQGNYNWIIQHRNYNPRIIETITNPDVWKNIAPKDFTESIRKFLDYPESIWKHVYENQISSFSQCILANILTCGTPILYEDLKKLMQNFSKNNAQKYGFFFSEIEFKKSITVLENTFILTVRDNSNQLAIEYKNPSVQDFLVNYFASSLDYIEDICESAIFFNQMYRIFEFQEDLNVSNSPPSSTNKILLNSKFEKLIVQKIITNYKLLDSSQVRLGKYSMTLKGQWHKIAFSPYKKLYNLIRKLPYKNNTDLRKFASDVFGELIVPDHFLNSDDLVIYIDLLNEFAYDHVFDENQVIELCFDSINYFSQVHTFVRLRDILTSSFENFLENTSEYQDKLENYVNEEASNVTDEYLEKSLDSIKEIGQIFNMEFYDAISKIEERKRDLEYDYYLNDRRFRNDIVHATPPVRDDNEDAVIKNMFDSL